MRFLNFMINVSAYLMQYIIAFFYLEKKKIGVADQLQKASALKCVFLYLNSKIQFEKPDFTLTLSILQCSTLHHSNFIQRIQIDQEMTSLRNSKTTMQ